MGQLGFVFVGAGMGRILKRNFGIENNHLCLFAFECFFLRKIEIETTICIYFILTHSEEYCLLEDLKDIYNEHFRHRTCTDLQ